MSNDSTEGGARVRASDAEREEYARVVREAVGDGRLSLDEGDERLAKIYAARFRDELRPLVGDLPREDAWSARGWRGPGRGGPSEGSGPRGEGAASGPEAWGGRPWGGRPWGGPWDRRGHRHGFARPGIIALTVAAVLVGIWALTGAHFFWPAIPLTILAIVLVRRACWRRWAHR
jgi:hypothetical protein